MRNIYIGSIGSGGCGAQKVGDLCRHLGQGAATTARGRPEVKEIKSVYYVLIPEVQMYAFLYPPPPPRGVSGMAGKY
jgi:hypothetical protein